MEYLRYGGNIPAMRFRRILVAWFLQGRWGSVRTMGGNAEDLKRKDGLAWHTMRWITRHQLQKPSSRAPRAGMLLWLRRVHSCGVQTIT